MIAIVGAGLVGSLLARLLRQRGFEVSVYERRSDPRHSTASAGRSINLVITSRGLYGLEMAELTQKIEPLAVPVYGRMIHSVSGELTYQAYGQENEFNLSISRDALNRFLIQSAEEIGVKFFFDHSLEKVNFDSSEVIFENSQRATYEVLFGADGAGSRVRKNLSLLQPEQKLDHTEWLEADYKELTLPLKNGSPALQTNALHIWPRGDHMMMALANKDGSFTVTLYLPKHSFEKLKSAEAVQGLFEREFKDAVPLMPDYTKEFLAHPQGALGTVRCSKWTTTNVALIGDAAHAIVPFFGQGMNCGFEDCTALMKLVDQNKTSFDWSKILKIYEADRVANANAIANMALENWVEMRDKVGDQRFLLRKKVETLLEQRHPSKYKSRYGLITYTLTPYNKAKEAGCVQNELLSSIIGSARSIDEIDWVKADSLIRDRWEPFAKSAGLSLNKYPA